MERSAVVFAILLTVAAIALTVVLPMHRSLIDHSAAIIVIAFFWLLTAIAWYGAKTSRLGRAS
jgi:hypothetical protein